MKKRFDIHQHITDQIIAAIEKGAGQFRLPWHNCAGAMMRPTNIASRKPYRGVNIVALWAASEQSGFGSGIWGTYRQWAEVGAQVRKGEKSSYVVFYKEIVGAASENDATDSGKRLLARTSFVFAAEQVDGFEIPTIATTAAPNPITPMQAVEAFVAATAASVAHGGTRAFYRPSTDGIQLPPRDSFIGTATSTPAESYYSTLLHELTHWTSHEQRCNRQLGKRFGDDAYAMEELIAELGAAFLCAELGITTEPRQDHAQYLTHWLSVLKADNRAIFTAASKASQAADWLHDLQPPTS